MLATAAALFAAGSPARSGAQTSTSAPAAASVVVFDAGLQSGWIDFGWSNKPVVVGQPVEVDMGDFGGWITAKPGGQVGVFGSVELSYSVSDTFAGALALRLGDDHNSIFPEVILAAVKADGTGMRRLSIGFDKLNPGRLRFDRIIVRGRVQLPKNSVIRISRIALTVGSGPTQSPARVGAPIRPTGSRAITADIDCASDRRPISPLIYGIAYDEIKDASSPQQWTMGATARRWGGNPTTRYNWQSHVWNTASDYFWQNVAVRGHEAFLKDNAAHGLLSVLTVPTIGWVAKDATSESFPVSVFGPQQAIEPDHPDAGNGVSTAGKKLPPGSPKTTSIAAPPDFVGRFVASVKGQVTIYQLDNEPEIWDSTHRDVHPNPVSYDELLKRTVDYASVIRQNDSKAVIAGPGSWGWLGYNYSGVDAAAGYTPKPDRLAHGDKPLLAWYLQQLREAEKQKGVRLLDVLDVHFYPQEENIYGQSGRLDPQGSALRIRSTRSLWDPTYTDESWIKDKIALLPRLNGWIADNYPGTKLSIGEWNFGGESHMSGALATAEALGRFGQNGVYAANYWTLPPVDSPVYWAFRAFRGVAGPIASGAHLGATSVRSTSSDPSNASVFASVDERGKMSAVVLNFSPATTLSISLRTKGCVPAGADVRLRQFSYDGSKPGFLGPTLSAISTGNATVSVQPWSINVVEIA